MIVIASKEEKEILRHLREIGGVEKVSNLTEQIVTLKRQISDLEISKSKKQEEPKAAPPAKPSAPGKPAAQAKTHVAEKPAPPAKPPSQKRESSATKESKAPITPDPAPKP